MSEKDLKALPSPNLYEIHKELMKEKVIVKATNEPRYVVACHYQLEKSKLKPETRVGLDMITLIFSKIYWLTACRIRTRNIFFFAEIGALSTDQRIKSGNRIISYKPRIIPV